MSLPGQRSSSTFSPQLNGFSGHSLAGASLPPAQMFQKSHIFPAAATACLLSRPGCQNLKISSHMLSPRFPKPYVFDPRYYLWGWDRTLMMISEMGQKEVCEVIAPTLVDAICKREMWEQDFLGSWWRCCKYKSIHWQTRRSCKDLILNTLRKYSIFIFLSVDCAFARISHWDTLHFAALGLVGDVL